MVACNRVDTQIHPVNNRSIKQRIYLGKKLFCVCNNDIGGVLVADKITEIFIK